MASTTGGPRHRATPYDNLGDFPTLRIPVVIYRCPEDQDPGLVAPAQGDIVGGVRIRARHPRPLQPLQMCTLASYDVTSSFDTPSKSLLLSPDKL
eukprot:CAMPEP_0202847010 /NCGR_PEP_ID=MMETSP1389-20130828/74374_1 /ASSEMBLY_ACC=CAM_ASM_000865 /TAXON_ID=302021 /ORGANISM="Rhodomonas sp., Strain CCMP768" /LENGTH=94 /DNA_ID=CAMNT_0049524657 /DNA_START=1 /DNA_END=281 /DNA_ORIENTATION=-